MAGLGAFMAAGLASGVGTGLVAQAKLDFEAAKQRAAQEARAKERAEDREFQTKRDEQNFQQSLKLKEVDDTYATKRLDRTESFQERQARERRDYEAAEKDKDRAARKGETFLGEDGTPYELKDGTATPYKGADGQPVRGLGRGTSQDKQNQFRLALKDAIEAGKPPKDPSGYGLDDQPHNWSKSVAQAKALGINIRGPEFSGVVEAGLKDQAEKDKGIPDKDAWVQGRLRALGIKDPVAGGEAVPPRMQKPEGGAAAPAPAAKPTDHAAAIAEAKAAIAAGKSRAAVIERLKTWGISTEGL